ncbi:MAG: hypothetical protein JWO32_1936 [Bacteroidetes bacterium]|nr:hypothetical protein [Bacteroidota bacterium]
MNAKSEPEQPEESKDSKEKTKLEDSTYRFKDKINKKYKTGKGGLYSQMDHLTLVQTTLERDKNILELEANNMELRRENLELICRLKIHEPEKYAKPNYNGYQTEWSNIRKVVFILKRNFNALTTTQVMQELLNLEPSYKITWNNPSNCVSGLLSTAFKNSLVVKVGSPGMGAPLYKSV